MASQKKVLCVGLTCLDMIQTVKSYPIEDSDQRSIDARWQRGGNASNNCTVLVQIGVKCEFLGTLGTDLTQEFLQNDFKRLNIDISHCTLIPQSSCPISTVLLNKQTGSRTIVHHSGTIPEIDIEQFKKLDLSIYSWIHFEGRNIAGVKAMLNYLAMSGNKELKTSVELEKTKPELNTLLPLADFVFLGRDYALSRGWNGAQVAVKTAIHEARPGATVICAWGALGAWAQQGQDGQLLHSPAFPPAQVEDSLGAGDTFTAAMIASQILGLKLAHGLQLACSLAGTKVGQTGLERLTEPWNAAKRDIVGL